MIAQLALKKQREMKLTRLPRTDFILLLALGLQSGHVLHLLDLLDQLVHVPNFDRVVKSACVGRMGIESVGDAGWVNLSQCLPEARTKLSLLNSSE